MKLDVTVDGLEGRIEILASAPACRFRIGEGEVREANIVVAEPGSYSIIIDGRSYDARVEETADSLVVAIDGRRFEIEVRDPRRWSRNSSARGGEGIQTVRAPMPGKIVRVLVSAGDEVQAGQGLVVVEAMKMQNEMKAARPGRVLSVLVKEGATVGATEVLVTIE